jgi:hypothetical protein
MTHGTSLIFISYRRLILRMHEEAKADVVERLLQVRARTYRGCSAHPQSMPARPA